MQSSGLVVAGRAPHCGDMTRTLDNKIAFITGGSRGLGREIAHRLAQQGADVVFTYVRSEEAATETARSLAELGVRAKALRADLTGTAQIAELVAGLEQVLADWGAERFDFLINNAGVGSNATATELTEDELDRQYETNLKSLVFLTQALLPSINDGGRILVLGTGLTRVAFPPMIAYAAIKSAVETFSRYLAQTLGPRGITVNAVAPGAIDNDFNRARFDAAPQVKDYIATNTALGRVGVPEDIGGVAAFLCSDDARWITGQRIEVSGGMKL